VAKVLLGMSGGVDSSVAAGLLVEEGHTVVGLTMKTYKYEEVGGNMENDTSCCSLDGINDARRVAMQLGIPHYVTDMTEEFGAKIIDYFKETYLAGETPNPCVKCNREIKWEAMLRKADALGCEYIATGHYARLRKENGRTIISRAIDNHKDQTYALWSVRQEHLERTMLPLSGLTKEASRAVARRLGLRIAEKNESFEICFVTDNNYRRFLKENVADIDTLTPPGQFVLHGEVVGKHEGVPFYTIGQRKGLGLSVPSHPEPLYVTGLDVLTNTVYVGDDGELFRTDVFAHSVNLIKYDALPTEGLRCVAKIRYKDEGAPATAYAIAANRMRITFDDPRRAVTPGQSVVLYEGDDLLGGGIIDRQ
jgi:tRNA-specific 2-thiouridylase